MSSKSQFEMEAYSKAYQAEAEEQARLMRLAKSASTSYAGEDETKGKVLARFSLLRWLAKLWLW